MMRYDTRNRRTSGVIIYINKDIRFQIISTKNIEQNTWISAIRLMGLYNEIIICNVIRQAQMMEYLLI